MPDRNESAELDAEILATVGRAATALAGQNGRGIARQAVVTLAGITPVRVTVFDGDPPIAVLRPVPPGTAPMFATLTAREREVAGLVAAGLRNAQIATELVVSVATVKDHLHRILRKTGLASRGAVAAAWRS